MADYDVEADPPDLLDKAMPLPERLRACAGSFGHGPTIQLLTEAARRIEDLTRDLADARQAWTDTFGDNAAMDAHYETLREQGCG